MTAALRLRPYQQEAIDAVRKAWENGVSPVAVVLPTGAGKTVIFSGLIDQAPEMEHGKALILVHRDELARQAAAKVHAMCPDLTVGIVKAERNEVHADVMVASVQTLRSPARMLQLDGVALVIVDECHHAEADSYRAILRHYGCLDDTPPEHRTPCVGVTATLERGDGRGLGGVFAEVAYARDIMWMIERRYLCDVRGKTVMSKGIDLGKVRRSRGDWSESELGHVMGQEIVCDATADAYLEHAVREDGSLRPGVLFAPTVDSAMAMADAFNRVGITTESLDGSMHPHERAPIYRRFRGGETTVLANCMILTEGWDEPHVEVAVIARPTMSAGLYQQMVGRVLRTFPGKPGALVLDVVGAAKLHKLASLIDMSVWRPKDGESLLEAKERELLEEEQLGDTEDVERIWKGPQYEAGGELGDVDLFAARESVWLQTRKGVWFVPGVETTWFLWDFGPELSTGMPVYGVASYASKQWAKPQMHQTGLPLDLAMSIIEQNILNSPMDALAGKRSASWRKGGKATVAQRNWMMRVGLPDDPELTKAQASDLRSVHDASQRIDPYVAVG